MHKVEKYINLISLIFLIWLLLSLCDTLAHNLSDYKYASWNLIEMYCNITGIR